MTRIYQPIPLKAHTEIDLDAKASHHLHVLRAQLNDSIRIFNGEGGEYAACLIHIGKKIIRIKISEFIAREAESPLDIYLAQGIARGEKMDFIIQKAVELGVKGIIPLITERVNVRLDATREAKRLDHWQAVIISACEQCGRNRLPQLSTPLSLKTWVQEVKTERKWVLSPHANLSLSSEPAPKSAAILIGPEGGLSEGEMHIAYQHGFTGLQLGPRILRTETAPLLAIALLQSHYGDIK